VVATDTSPRQLARVGADTRIWRVVGAAEAVPLRERCADLVTVSAAIHWFDRPRFYAEARRVAREGAIVAVWSYYQRRIEPAIDAAPRLGRRPHQAGAAAPRLDPGRPRRTRCRPGSNRPLATVPTCRPARS